MDNVVCSTLDDALVQSPDIVLQPCLTFHQRHMQLIEKFILEFCFRLYILRYISQSSHLGSETSDLIIQIGMHWINPQLDFIRAGCWSCAKTLP